jgi:hypothetical protein
MTVSVKSLFEYCDFVYDSGSYCISISAVTFPKPCVSYANKNDLKSARSGPLLVCGSRGLARERRYDIGIAAHGGIELVLRRVLNVAMAL